MKCFRLRLVFTVFVAMFTYKVVFDFLLHFANFIALKKEKDSVPRVRFASFCQFHCLKKGKRFRAPCEDRTHDLQISAISYETDALPTALTRHLQILL